MKKNVLVVDDDAAIRKSLGKVLQEAGYAVTLAAGGLEAAVRFEPGEIDLVLLDLNLPNQNGWEVYEHMTTQHPAVPIIIITGMPDQYRMASSAGVGALFEKPVNTEELLKTMQDLLDEAEKAGVNRLCGHRTDTRYAPAMGRLGGQRRECAAKSEMAALQEDLIRRRDTPLYSAKPDHHWRITA